MENTQQNRPGEEQTGQRKPGQEQTKKPGQDRPGDKEGSHGGHNPSQQNPRDRDRD